MVLSYGTAQIVVGIVFAVLAACLAAVFIVVALRARPEVAAGRVQEVAYWIRRRWLAFLVALMVIVVGAALLTQPYARGSGADRTHVAVTGGQFYWTIRPAEVPAGAPLRFEVTAADVNHGFGIYDPDGRLIGSVQAMPGYTNTLDITLDQPGRYRIRCLEFCGIAHHRMDGSFTVTAGR